jgi:glucan phosphoethanolaminetransferase (alkaline phosphatase superfamily)
MKKLLTEKRKRNILVFLILWLLLAIVFVVPLSVAYTDSLSPKGGLQLDSFKSIIVSYILSLKIRVKAFQELYKSNTTNALGYYTFFYLMVMLILILKSKGDKGDYHDIEHGSSDWCEDGEQYKVLSKNSGIILAQKNYLPIDKPGNVNVLIVGRIWCW